MSEDDDFNANLGRVRAGDEGAAAVLFPLVYDQLRRIAGRYLAGQAQRYTLQPTAVVHEAYLRLVRPGAAWQDRAHFVALAATAMRQILTDQSRRRSAEKRGGGRAHITLTGVAASTTDVDAVEVLALDRALTKLAALSPRQARIVELQHFGGLTVDEVAEVLDVSKSLVEKEWRRARAWLRSELSAEAAEAAEPAESGDPAPNDPNDPNGRGA